MAVKWKPHHPLFLTDNIQQEMENARLFYIVFQVSRKYFCEKLQDTATTSFISCYTSVFISSDSNFYKFIWIIKYLYQIFSTLSEKTFANCTKFSFFNRFIQNSHPLTLTWVGFLAVRFEVRGGGVKLPLLSKTW